MASEKPPRFDPTHVHLLKRGYLFCERCRAYIRNLYCPFCKQSVRQIPLQF